MKHTPKPWVIDDGSACCVWRDSLPKGSLSIKSMGTCWALGEWVAATPPGNLADATLIAAAPDLLEALQHMISLYIPFPSGDTEFWREQFEANEQAHLAISKALGTNLAE